MTKPVLKTEISFLKLPAVPSEYLVRMRKSKFRLSGSLFLVGDIGFDYIKFIMYYRTSWHLVFVNKEQTHLYVLVSFVDQRFSKPQLIWEVEEKEKWTRRSTFSWYTTWKACYETFERYMEQELDLVSEKRFVTGTFRYELEKPNGFRD